jgi:hypothetical protein
MMTETQKRYRRDHIVEHLAGHQRWRKKKYRSDRDFREEYLRRGRDNYERNKAARAASRAKLRSERKLIVLSHYGKEGMLCCCWDGCQETDIDCLTLDHIDNNGGDHRRKVGNSGIYFDVIKNGFPPGFQTLCGSHQMKKEMVRKRG